MVLRCRNILLFGLLATLCIAINARGSQYSANMFLNGEYKKSAKSQQQHSINPSSNIFLEHAIISRQAAPFQGPTYLPPVQFIKCSNDQQCVRKNVCQNGYYTQKQNPIAKCNPESDVCCSYRPPATPSPTTPKPHITCRRDQDCVSPNDCQNGEIVSPNYIHGSAKSSCHAPNVCCLMPSTTLTENGYRLKVPDTKFPLPKTPQTPPTRRPPQEASKPTNEYLPPKPQPTRYTPQPQQPQTTRYTPQPQQPQTTRYTPQPQTTRYTPQPPQPKTTRYTPQPPQPPQPQTTRYTPQPPQPQTTLYTPQQPQPQTTRYTPQQPQPQTTRYTPQQPQPQTTRYTPQQPQPQTTRYTPKQPQPQTTYYKPTNAYLPPTQPRSPTPNRNYLPPSEKDNEVPKESRTVTNRAPAPIRGESLLSPTITPNRNFNVPAPAPSKCASALVCTPEEYCSAIGVVSDTPVDISPASKAFRVPLTDCILPDSGSLGKCCRDANYVDPWPVNKERVCGTRNRGTKPQGISEIDTNFGEIPWQAMILKDSSKEILCGGAIVGPEHVLTTAECVRGLTESDCRVKAGEWELGNTNNEPLPFQISGVKYIKIHPTDDLAIIRMSKRLSFAQHIKPICISNEEPKPNDKCITTGWGKQALRAHEQGAIMHVTETNVLSRSDCGASQSSVCSSTKFDSCQFDSGSALACGTGSSVVLKGIFSAENNCGEGQAVRFTKPDISWINKEVKLE